MLPISIDKQILELMRAFADGDLSDDYMLQADEKAWVELFNICWEQKLLAIAYDKLCRLPSFENCSSQFCNLWRREARFQLAIQTEKSETMKQLCAALNDRNIKYFVIKGILNRSMYKNGELRVSADEDIFIRPQDIEAVCGVLSENGFYTIDDKIKFGKNDSSLALELHTALLDVEQFNDVLSIDWNRDYYNVIDGTSIRTLPPTDTFIFMALHAAVHFITGGFGIRTACDIGMFARINGKEINWSRVQKTLETVNAFEFTKGILNICESMGFSYEKAACPGCMKTELKSDGLLADIMDAGVYGQSTMNRKHSSMMTEAAYNNSGFHTVRAVFPKRKSISYKYTYLEKYPFLLPVAWFSRGISYLTEVIRHKGKSNPAESISIGKKRVELIRYYGLYGKK